MLYYFSISRISCEKSAHGVDNHNSPFLSGYNREATSAFFLNQVKFDNVDDDQPCDSVLSYLRYQGTKFVDRFDANCYVALVRQMCSHNVGCNRGGIFEALGSIEQPVLIIGIDSDNLFPLTEQLQLAVALRNSQMEVFSRNFLM